MLSIGLVLIHHPLEHGFEDFVNRLNLAIALRAIGGEKLLLKFQNLCMFLPNCFFEVRILIGHQLASDAKLVNNVIGKETC